MRLQHDNDLNLYNDILLRHGFLGADINDLGVSIVGYSVVIDILCASMVAHGVDMDICVPRLFLCSFHLISHDAMYFLLVQPLSI